MNAMRIADLEKHIKTLPFNEIISVIDKKVKQIPDLFERERTRLYLILLAFLYNGENQVSSLYEIVTVHFVNAIKERNKQFQPNHQEDPFNDFFSTSFMEKLHPVILGSKELQTLVFLLQHSFSHQEITKIFSTSQISRELDFQMKFALSISQQVYPDQFIPHL